APLARAVPAGCRLLRQGARARIVLARMPAALSRPLIPGKVRRALGRIGVGAAALLIFLWSAGPFLWLIVMSLSPSADLVRSPPSLVPHTLTFENYGYVLFPKGVSGGQSAVQASRVPLSIWNSLVVAVAVTAIHLVLS